MTKSTMSNDQFKKIWQDSGSLADVAKKYGRSLPATSAKATMLRKAGINLKKFQVGRKPGPQGPRAKVKAISKRAAPAKSVAKKAAAKPAAKVTKKSK